MQEASVLEVTAAEARERLMAFMAEVVAGLPHVRQRENALLYVRGLVEEGGRKSLWPRFFGWGRTPPATRACSSFWLTRLGSQVSSLEPRPSGSIPISE